MWADTVPLGSLSKSEKATRSTLYQSALNQLSLMHNKMRDDDAVMDKNKKNGKLDEKKSTETYAELSACCKKTFHAMSSSGVVSSAAPEGDELELEWIHGTRQF